MELEAKYKVGDVIVCVCPSGEYVRSVVTDIYVHIGKKDAYIKYRMESEKVGTFFSLVRFIRRDGSFKEYAERISYEDI